jgi:hypothetical protein
MPEIEREEILAGRQEELMRIQDKRKLHEMLQAQSGDPESTSKIAKRTQSALWYRRPLMLLFCRPTYIPWRHKREVSYT